MRPIRVLQLLVLALALCSVGCASKNKGKIEGTRWSSQPTNVKGTTLPAGALQLDFTSDGKVTYTINTMGGGQQVFSGRYSLGMMDYVTMNFDQELAGRKSHTEKISISGSTLTMTDTDQTSITFDKVK